MSKSDSDRIRYPDATAGAALVPTCTADQGEMCPRCGGRAAGPYSRRVGKGDRRGLYYKHSVGGRDVWHYVPKGSGPKRREELVTLLHQQGFRGLRHFARLLGVSTKTIQRDLNALQSDGRIIHRPYGTYIADPGGKMLKERPWLAWTD